MVTETMAEAIYYLMPFDDSWGRVKPKWVENGNSEKQDEARTYAYAATSIMAEHMAKAHYKIYMEGLNSLERSWEELPIDAQARFIAAMRETLTGLAT